MQIFVVNTFFCICNVSPESKLIFLYHYKYSFLTFPKTTVIVGYVIYGVFQEQSKVLLPRSIQLLPNYIGPTIETLHDGDAVGTAEIVSISVPPPKVISKDESNALHPPMSCYNDLIIPDALTMATAVLSKCIVSLQIIRWIQARPVIR